MIVSDHESPLITSLLPHGYLLTLATSNKDALVNAAIVLHYRDL
jgi:hypothetical protein